MMYSAYTYQEDGIYVLGTLCADCLKDHPDAKLDKMQDRYAMPFCECCGKE